MSKEDNRTEIFIKKENSIKKWYVLYVKSRHERVANEALIKANFKTYFPVKKELKTWSQRKKWVEEPIFKSYIFIKIYRHELYHALKVDNVVTYVRFAGEPAVVREEHLLLVKKMLINQTSFEVQKGIIAIGKEITIKTGPFKGYSGKITELRGTKKFVVELQSTGSYLEISLKDVIPPAEINAQSL